MPKLVDDNLTTEQFLEQWLDDFALRFGFQPRGLLLEAGDFRRIVAGIAAGHLFVDGTDAIYHHPAGDVILRRSQP